MFTKGCVTRNDCGRHGNSCEVIFFRWCCAHDDCNCHCSDCEASPFRRCVTILVVFLLIVMLVILVIFLVLHPHKPRFDLQNATVRQLIPSDGLLNSSLQFSVVSHNPNDRIGILYDSLSTYVSYMGEQITPQYLLPPFYQDDNDVNILTPILGGNFIPLAPVVYEDLNSELQNELVSLNLIIDGTIRWKVGTWTSGDYHLNVNCLAILDLRSNGVGDQVPLLPGTRCHLQV